MAIWKVWNLYCGEKEEDARSFPYASDSPDESAIAYAMSRFAGGADNKITVELGMKRMKDGAIFRVKAELTAPLQVKILEVTKVTQEESKHAQRDP